ncbi:MAG: TRAP transporter substrate-binding protein [Syntrophomonadaceae bacterium]|nr:TRAP transporter substrate-binding protein [Syntrophomonadaceae bacterium]
MFKRLILLLVVLSLVFSVVGCGARQAEQKAPAPAPAPEKFAIRVAHTTSPESHYHQGLLKFDELLRAKSNGRVELQIFHSAQLGSERDAIEGVSLGTLEMTLVSSAPLSGFSDKFLAFDLPFIIQDRQKAYTVFDGPIGKEILASLEPKGILGLGIWENGFRMLTNNKRPIMNPEDVKGLKIRLMENPVHVATFKHLGAHPVPMPFGEVFTALQQGTIDGQENPLVIINTSKFYEVQKHVALTGHFYAPAPLLINKKFFDGLPQDIQKIILEAEKEARTWQRNFCIQLEGELVAKLEAAGMQVTRPDKKAWQEATRPIYQQFEARIGKDIIDALIQ